MQQAADSTLTVSCAECVQQQQIKHLSAPWDDAADAGVKHSDLAAITYHIQQLTLPPLAAALLGTPADSAARPR